MFRLILFISFMFLSNAYAIDFPNSNSPQEYIVHSNKELCIDKSYLILEIFDTTKELKFKIFNKCILTNNNLYDYGIISKRIIIAFDKFNNKCNDKKVLKIECNKNFIVDFYAKWMNDKMLNEYLNVNSTDIVANKIKMHYLFDKFQNCRPKIFDETFDSMIEIKNSIQNILIERFNILIVPNYFDDININVVFEYILSDVKYNSVLKQLDDLHFLQTLNITLTHFEDSI